MRGPDAGGRFPGRRTAYASRDRALGIDACIWCEALSRDFSLSELPVFFRPTGSTESVSVMGDERLQIADQCNGFLICNEDRLARMS